MPRPTMADDLSQKRADRSPSKESRRPSKDTTSKAQIQKVYGKGFFSQCHNTVDGRNPAPVDG